jgi:hypothetical protein
MTPPQTGKLNEQRPEPTNYRAILENCFGRGGGNLQNCRTEEGNFGKLGYGVWLAHQSVDQATALWMPWRRGVVGV